MRLHSVRIRIITVLCALCMLVGGYGNVFGLVAQSATKRTTLTASDGKSYEISVAFGPSSGVSEDAVLRVKEIREDGKEPDESLGEYGSYVEETARMLKETSESLAFARVFDIALTDPVTGEEYRPSSDVRVSVRLPDQQYSNAENVEVIHFGESCEIIESEVQSDGTIGFDTDGFSVYVITETSGLHRKYTFHVPNADVGGQYTEYALTLDNGATVYSQVVREGEKPVIPQVTDYDSKAFVGWYVGYVSGDSLLLADEKYDFDHLPPLEHDEDIDLYAKYSGYVYAVFHDQYDSGSGNAPVAFLRRAEVSDGGTTAYIRIDGLRTTFNGGAGGEEMAFFGWSLTPVSTPGSESDDNGDPVSVFTWSEGDEHYGEIPVTDTVHLYPVYKPIHWLTYYTAPSGSGATYIPARYYFDGEGERTLPVPVYAGHEFTGWYTGTLSVHDGSETVNYGTKIAEADGELILGADNAGVYVYHGDLLLRADSVLYAGWNDSAVADYRVVVYKQLTTDTAENETTGKNYEFAADYRLTGNVSQTVSVGNEYKSLNFDGWVYEKCDADKVLTADGMTVLNVYYSLSNYDYVPSGAAHTVSFFDSAEDPAAVLPDPVSLEYGDDLLVLSGELFSAQRRGYTFSGWFSDRDCTVPMDLATMPDHDMSLFAGWETDWYLVKIDPNYGDLHGNGATWFWEEYNGDPIQEYTHVTRDYVQSSSGKYFYVRHDRDYYGYPDTWVPGEDPSRTAYYTQDPGEATEYVTFESMPGFYRYAGWYQQMPDGSEELYDFDRRVEGNVSLKLHWKRVGTYYVDYASSAMVDGVRITGSFSETDPMEPVFAALNGTGFADNAEIVIIRSLIPPAGFAFEGWAVRGDDSGRIYRVGDLFTVPAEYALTVNSKETVYLDPVFSKVHTAAIVYDANGGTVGGPVDFGEVVSGGNASVVPVTSFTEDTATVSNLSNNCVFRLSDGSGFSRDGAVFVGWSAKKTYSEGDQLFTGGTNYGVNKDEPVTLYAVWSFDVRFHLNSEGVTGGEWGSPYTYDAANRVYTVSVYAGNPVSEPAHVPEYSGADTRMFFNWRTAPHEFTGAPVTGEDGDVYDFSLPVVSALDLYAFWAGPITVPVHAVDSTAVTPEVKDGVWIPADRTQMPVTTSLMLTDGFIPTPEGFEFAFAALSDSVEGVSEENALYALYYSTTEKRLCAVFTDDQRADELVYEGQEVWFVFYKKSALDIGYLAMDPDGTTTALHPAGAPTRTGVGSQFDIPSVISAPASLVDPSLYPYYSYAVGDGSPDKLCLVTAASSSDADRPALRIRQTWRGYECSSDGGATWTGCGYQPVIFVIYHPSEPVSFTVTQTTLGTGELTDTPFGYTAVVSRTDTGDEVYSQSFTLRDGESRSFELYSVGGVSQKITVTHTPDPRFLTAIPSQGPQENNSFEYVYSSSDTDVTADFTDTHRAISVDVHTAVVRDGRILADDSVRTTVQLSHTLTVPFSETVDITGSVSPSDIFVPTAEYTNYAFGMVLLGREDTDGSVEVRTADLSSASYSQKKGGVYELFVSSGDASEDPVELGSWSVYYLFYKMPRIRYVYERPDRLVTGSYDGTTVTTDVTYDRRQAVMNSATVAQDQLIEIPLKGFVISQESSANVFKMPPVLDYMTYPRFLSYSSVAIGTGAGITASADGQVMRFRIGGSRLEYSFDGAGWFDMDDDDVVIYAVYTERGYDLEIAKSVDTDASGSDPVFDRDFEVTISSDAITKSSYATEGGHDETVAATPAASGVPGTITLTVTDGTRIRILGLSRGEYTVTESGNDNYTLTVNSGSIVGASNGILPVTDGSSAVFELDSDKKIELANTPKALCRIVYDGSEHLFYTMKSAVAFISDRIPEMTGTVEMLEDYLMPALDPVEIPNGCSVTVTTAESKSSIAVLKRSDELADRPMITNNGTLILESVALDGALLESDHPMISSRGDLTAGSGAVLKNAVNVGEGGAILATAGNITVDDARITDNTASEGGAIYYTGSGSVRIQGTSLVRNNTASSGRGGAVFASAGSVSVGEKSSLSSNTASGNGGAVYIGNASLTVEQGAGISGNEAESGGAVYAETASVTVEAKDGLEPQIANNTARGGDGGAFCIRKGSVSVIGGSFAGNIAASGSGGAICGGETSVAVSGGAVFASNEASRGGAVYTASGSVSTTASEFSDNKALAGSGGAIRALTGGVTAKNSRFEGNSSTGDGGAVSADSGRITFENCSASSNTASGAGGFASTQSASVSLTAGSVIENNVAAEGGAVRTASGSVTVNGSSLNGNRAVSGRGGAILSDSGSVSVTDGEISGNRADSDGGAVCAVSGDLNLTRLTAENNAASADGGAICSGSGNASVSGGSFNGNTAAGRGGAFYQDSGTLTLNSVSASGNGAINGSAVFDNTGRAVFSGGTYSGNTASQGGAVGVGSVSARLSFSGDVKVENNLMGSEAGNVYLDQDDDAVIIADSLGTGASLGICVPDPLVGSRSVPGSTFAVYLSNANADKITNDRFPSLKVVSDTAAKKLYWGSSVKVEVRYLASFAGGFPPAAAGTSKYTNDDYYPGRYDGAVSELASELYTGYTLNLTATAVYAGAFAQDAASYSDDISRLVWDVSASKWTIVKRDGTTEDLNGRKIIVYYSEPAYISIENNTQGTLKIDSLTVGSTEVINSSSNAGYGMVFAKNGAIRTALLPVTGDDLTLAPGSSVNLLIPGGRNRNFTAEGGFSGDFGTEVRLRRTGAAEQMLPLDGSGAFAPITGVTPNSSSAYTVVFGDDKLICKIEDQNGVEHPYSRISDAITAVRNGALDLEDPSAAVIEMLTDYLLPASDRVEIPTGYDITITTASKTGKVFNYTGEGDRATISRDSENTSSMINSWNDLVGGKVVTTLRLRDLIFDGKSVRGSSDGGGVYSRYTLVYIERTDFRSVYASNGGALLVMFSEKDKNNKTTMPGTVMEVKDSNFIGCSSTTTVTSNRLGGGAIVTNAETMTLENCLFDTCTSVDQAGAVFHRVDGNYNSYSNIRGCSFINCSANAAGGLELDSKTINVEDCVFDHCVAKVRNGGGFNVYALNTANPSADCWVNVTGCTFNDCQLTGTNGGNGGGFRSNAVYTKVADSTFTNSTAIYGGGFCMSNTAAKKGEIYGCTFERCTATGQGGGVYGKPLELIIGDFDDGAGNVRHTVISGCVSKNEGGGVYHDRNANNSSLSVTNAVVTGNQTKNNGKNGGGIFTNSWKVTVSGARITDNRCTNFGGGLYAYSRTSLTVDDSVISRNNAASDGGGVWLSSDDTGRRTLKLTVTGSTVDGNTSGRYGGGVFTNAQVVTITESLTATDENGDPVRSSVSGNTARSGGGLYHNSAVTGSRLMISDADINSNTATNGAGGGVYARVLSADLADSSVSRNSSTGDGGGINIDADTAENRSLLTVVLKGCAVDLNSSSSSGGGLYTLAKTVNVGASETRADAGGDPVRASFAGNTASKNGGGIFHSSELGGSSLTVSDADVSRNESRSDMGGGGVYSDAYQLTLRDALISENVSLKSGGGVYHNSSGDDRSLVLDHTDVTQNTAGTTGGGLSVKSQLTLINTVSVTGNRLSTDTFDNAAGVYLLDGRTMFIGVAGAEGETVYIRGNTTSSGSDSNLRLPMTGAVNSVDGMQLDSDHLYGEICVVNAAKVGTQFGTSAEAFPNGFSDSDAVFHADRTTLHGIVDRKDTGGKKIIWAGEPIAKITDADGVLLYLKSNGTSPAIFDQLGTGDENFSSAAAFNMLISESPELYYKDGSRYDGSVYAVKMLNNYEAQKNFVTAYYSSRTVIFTTAGRNDADYPYVGPGTRATVTRGSGVGNRSLMNARTDTVLTNIVLDSRNEDGAIASNTQTRCLNVENKNGAQITVRLEESALIQNGYARTGKGGGVYIVNGKVILAGGIIRSCKAQSGGGVYVENNGSLEIDAGNIYQCSSDANGGGIYVNGSLDMRLGTVERCHAAQSGGGVYVANDRSMSMSGGYVISNTAQNSGAGIMAGGANTRIRFSQKPTVSSNYVGGDLHNVEMNYDSNAVINTADGGLHNGAYIGIYIADGANLFNKHGTELKPFGTFADGDSLSTLYGFVNDRNGLKGGLAENPQPHTIYWIKIFSIEISKTSEISDNLPDDFKLALRNTEFSYTITLRGTSNMNISAKDINGEYGGLTFYSNGRDTSTAAFTLKTGEKISAENLPAGLDYEVIERITDEQKKFFVPIPASIYTGKVGENAREGVDESLWYVSYVNFVNRHPVCKIMNNDGAQLYVRYGSDHMIPAIFTDLKDAFEALDGLYVGDSPTSASYSASNGVRIRMLVPEYLLPERISALSSQNVIIETADPGEPTFPYQGASGNAKITRAFDGGSMFVAESGSILGFGAVTVDGNGKLYSSGSGGIALARSGGDIAVRPGAILQNSRAEGMGGAIYAAPDADIIMTGGKIINNQSSSYGAGVYLSEGSRMKISGSVDFGGKGTTAFGDGLDKNKGNFSLIPLTGFQTNGGKTYEKARQDIFIAENSDGPASLTVDGDIYGEDGSVWVWAQSEKHRAAMKPFAAISDSLSVSDQSYTVFRNAQPDAVSLCLGGQYLTGARGENERWIYWSGGVDVVFKKTDGFGRALAGAAFSLYDSLTSTDPTLIMTEGTRSESVVSKGAFVTEGGIEYNVSFNVSPGLWYMRETAQPGGYLANGSVYRVIVGSAAADSVGATLPAGTAFMIQRLDTSGAAEEVPLIASYGVVNISSVPKKVILRKTDSAYRPIAGAKFELLRVDMTPVDGENVSASSGVFWAGRLPYGTYYVHETLVPDGFKRLASDDNWYRLTVDENGAGKPVLLKAKP